MASYVMCVWLINPGASLADLIAPQHDAIALDREVAKVRLRIRPQKLSAPLAYHTVASSVHTASGLAALIEKAQGTLK